MIDWFARVDPDRPYLIGDEGTISYGEMRELMSSARTAAPKVVRPKLTFGGVADLLSAMAGGGAVVLGPEHDVPEMTEMAGSSLVVLTSGSAGKPKGVRLTIDNMEAAAQASMRHLGHGANDKWLLAMPLHHVGGISILVRSAVAGGSVRMLDGFDPPAVSALMKGGVTVVSLVPTMLARVLDLDDGPYRGLLAVLVGGGPIPHGLLAQASEAGIPALPSYGMTETFGQVATLRPGSQPAHHAHALPGVDIQIRPNGRIALRSAQISPGYLGEPDRADPWFLSGDLGSLSEEGALTVLGRADRVIVTGGENVDPSQVEMVLASHPDIEEVAVIGLESEVWGSEVAVAYQGAVETSSLETWAREQLSASHMIPKHWVRVEGLPRDDMGKISSEQVRALFGESG